MTIIEQEGKSRRDDAAGVAVSVVAHVALVAFVVQMPVSTHQPAAAQAALFAPIEQYIELPSLPKMAPIPEVVAEKAPSVTPATIDQGGIQLAEASGGAGGVPDAIPPAGEPSPAAPMSMTVAVAEGENASAAPVDSVAQSGPATSGLGRVRESEVTGTAGAGGSQPAAHIPGSAARAKSGGSGNGTGIGTGSGSGPSIIIGGPKRHPKRHPPRGIPGRRGW